MSIQDMPNDSLSLTLILGGVRAGKSARALQLAEARAAELMSANQRTVLFVATAQAFDNEMTQRIAAHKAERSREWSTLEEPLAIASGIRAHLANSPQTTVIIIDCLTLWVSNILLACVETDDVEAVVSERTRELLACIRELAQTSSGTNAPRHWIIVSNEVGLGVVPPTLLGRQYRDALGRANQLVAEAATDVVLMVAGLELPLKTRGSL